MHWTRQKLSSSTANCRSAAEIPPWRGRCQLLKRSGNPATAGLLLLLLPLLLSFGCEVPVPTETYDNPLDIEEAEKEGIETPALVFFKDSVAVNIGASVSIQVFVMEVENLGGARVQLNYDENKLSLNSVNVGGFFEGTADPVFFYEDDGSGTVDIFTSFLGTDSAHVSGTGDLAYLVFSATIPGKSTLTYISDRCELVDPDDNAIQIKGFGEGVIDAR